MRLSERDVKSSGVQLHCDGRAVAGAKEKRREILCRNGDGRTVLTFRGEYGLCGAIEAVAGHGQAVFAAAQQEIAQDGD